MGITPLHSQNAFDNFPMKDLPGNYKTDGIKRQTIIVVERFYMQYEYRPSRNQVKH